MHFLLLAGVLCVVGGLIVMLRKDPVSIAQTFVGTSSQGHPRFHGPPFELFAIAGEQPLAWCARFCRHCYAEAGTPLPGNRFLIASVTNLETALAAAGMLLPASAEPRRGDLILLRGDGSGRDGLGFGDRHVAIVENVDGDNIDCIDGDVGTPDRVMRIRRRRGMGHISGFGRVA